MIIIPNITEINRLHDDICSAYTVFAYSAWLYLEYRLLFYKDLIK